MIADPLFYALALPAVMVTGISKGGFGGGVGVLSVPLMALAVSPFQAAAVMLPILCVMDVVGVWAYRGRWDRGQLRILLPVMLGGVALGTTTFRYFDADMLRLLLGAIAVGFTLRHWFARNAATRPPHTPSRWHGWWWGAVSGFTSFIAHAGGTPLNIYLLPQRLDRTAFVATKAALFMVVNYLKLVPYALLGQFSAENLATSAVLAPLAPIGIGLGIWLHRRVPEQLFYRLCYAFLFVAGLKLLGDGVAALAA